MVINFGRKAVMILGLGLLVIKINIYECSNEKQSGGEASRFFLYFYVHLLSCGGLLIVIIEKWS